MADIIIHASGATVDIVLPDHPNWAVRGLPISGLADDEQAAIALLSKRLRERFMASVQSQEAREATPGTVEYEAKRRRQAEETLRAHEARLEAAGIPLDMHPADVTARIEESRKR